MSVGVCEGAEVLLMCSNVVEVCVDARRREIVFAAQLAVLTTRHLCFSLYVRTLSLFSSLPSLPATNFIGITVHIPWCICHIKKGLQYGNYRSYP